MGSYFVLVDTTLHDKWYVLIFQEEKSDLLERFRDTADNMVERINR